MRHEINLRVVLIVQARMGSTRLPSKVLKEVLDKPLLAYQIERLGRVKNAAQVMIATTTNPEDQAIVEFCRQAQIPLFRGSEDDVLDRYYQAAKALDADVIVRISGDCPLIDPEIVDFVIDFYVSQYPAYDYVSNTLERTYPRGMDVEVFSFKALERAAQAATKKGEREHVTPYLYEHPELFNLGSVVRGPDASQFRWTVDTDEDFELISLILKAIYPLYPHFTMQDIFGLLEVHPEWSLINADVKQKPIHDLDLSQRKEKTAIADSFSLECVRPIKEHARLIMEWRNDPDTLAMSYDSEPKQWKAFFPEFVSSYFIFSELHPLFVVLNGERVAFLRFSRVQHPVKSHEKCCEIGINVAPKWRGKGLGKKSLKLALAWLAQQGYHAVYAEVKKRNKASKKTFLRAGFTRLEDSVKQVFSSGSTFPIYRFLAEGKTSSLISGTVFIIAEAGSNWCVGTMEENKAMAFRLIEAAAEAGADAVKFQVFRPETIYVANAGTPDYLSSAGIKEGMEDLFARLAMPYELVPLLSEKCRACNIEFMASPFSAADFKAVDPYVSRHKVASYEIGHRTLLNLVACSGKPVILSTGAATDDEISWALHFLKEHHSGPVTLLQCTACYPAKEDSLHLRTIPWLAERFGVAAGLSDHSRHPLYAPLAAVALGATAVEKHFTMDNKLPGPDHAFAVTPPELTAMVQAVRHIETMLGSEVKIIDASERELRAYARRGVQAILAINEGDILRENVNIAILRPGQQQLGVHPKFLDEMEGKQARRSIKKGSGILVGDW